MSPTPEILTGLMGLGGAIGAGIAAYKVVKNKFNNGKQKKIKGEDSGFGSIGMSFSDLQIFCSKNQEVIRVEINNLLDDRFHVFEQKQESFMERTDGFIRTIVENSGIIKETMSLIIDRFNGVEGRIEDLEKFKDSFTN